MTTARRWPPNARLLPALRLRRFRPALFAAIRAPLPTGPACVAQLFSPATRRSALVTSRLNPQIAQNLVVFVRVRFALHLVQSPSVVDHLQVIQRPQHRHVALCLRRFPQHRGQQDPPLPIHLHRLPEIAGPQQKLALDRVCARQLRQLVFNLAPYLHGVDAYGFTCWAGDVELVAKFLQSVEKHGGYLQTTLLVHLRWTVSPQFHVSHFVGESVCPIPPQPSRPPYSTLLKSTFNHFCPHLIPIGKHVKEIQWDLCKSVDYFRLMFVFSSKALTAESIHDGRSIPIPFRLFVC